VNGTPESTLYLVTIGALYLIVKSVSVIHSNHFIDEYLPKGSWQKPAASQATDQAN
jgi:hypothetical protein